MPNLLDAKPQISVRLYKSIARKTVDGQTAVSARYEGKSEYIDLTPFLNDGSSVRTSKSVREPAGAFSINFADRPQNSVGGAFAAGALNAIESIYGLVEPMDCIEIRMWSGTGPKPAKLPIKMRGFITDVQRMQTMGQDGRPQRQVVVTGHDYGKIWQMFQVIHLAAYSERQALLTNFGLWEMFGVQAVNTMSAGEFVRTMIQKVINPFLVEFMPPHSPMPKEIKTGDSISVKHGVVNNSYQSMQGSIYDILKLHGDVGYWNELYVEDREDGVHCVYRPVPALHLTRPDDPAKGLIQDDATMPPIVSIQDNLIKSISTARSDANVANFYWVNNSRFDLIDDMQRKLASIPKDDGKVSIKEYPNSAVKYYATRPMYAETQQGDDEVANMGSGQDKETQEKRSTQQEAWIDKRRRILVEMNRDNVVFERGYASIKGGLMRKEGKEAMKVGDYAEFSTGRIKFLAYVVQIEDEFIPFQGYTTTLVFERGEGFITRARKEGGIESPWLAEQATRGVL